MSRDALILDAVAGKRPSATGWVRGDCPLCELKSGKADRKQCLGLEVTTGHWHCFRCGARGLLADVDIPTSPRAPAVANVVDLPDGFFELYREPGRSAFMAEGARDYLADRGVDEVVGRAARIGACLVGRYRGRIVVPVYAPEGALVGWSARDFLGQSERKYLYPEGMRRALIMYNAAALLVDSTEPVFVVEGVFDALALWPDGAGCLGKPSPPQVEMLRATTRPVVVLLDGDAWRESFGLASKLRAFGKRAGSVRLPPKTDPATADLDAVRAAAVRAIESPAQVWA